MICYTAGCIVLERFFFVLVFIHRCRFEYTRICLVIALYILDYVFIPSGVLCSLLSVRCAYPAVSSREGGVKQMRF
jgi:hypothetical protein